jgi:membrane-bound ClpP family serine protease
MKNLLITLLLTFSVYSYAETYKFTLPEVINEGSLKGLRNVLDSAYDKDVITIDTDSFGGSSEEMILTISSMARTKAHTICIAREYSASAAALITLACKSRVIHDDAILLFHMPRVISERDGQRSVVHVITINSKFFYYRAVAEQYAIFMESLGVKKIIGKRKFEEMIRGKDILIYGREIR